MPTPTLLNPAQVWADNKNKNTFLKFSDLYDYQVLMIDKATTFNPTVQSGSYIVMPTGYGKTHVLVSIALLHIHCNYRIVIINTAKTDSQFEETFQALSITDNPTLRTYIHYGNSNWKVSFNRWFSNSHHKNLPVCLLVDEAHNLGSTRVSSGQFRDVLPDIIGFKGRVYLFSATPVMREFHDLKVANLLIPPFRLKMGKYLFPSHPDEFDSQFGRDDGPEIQYNIDAIGRKLAGYVHYVEKKSIIPRMNPHKMISISMTSETYHKYVLVWDDNGNQTGSFGFVQEVRVMMEMDGNKVREVIRQVHKANAPVMVYCKFPIVVGKVLMEEFRKERIPAVVLSSEVSGEGWVKDLEVINSKENRDGSKIKVVILGPAGSTGINILTCKKVIFMSVPDTFNEFLQAVGRIRRSTSLAWLDEKDRVIDVDVMCLGLGEDVVKMLPNPDRIFTTKEELLHDDLLRSKLLHEQTEVMLKRFNILKEGGGVGGIVSDEDLISMFSYW